MRLLKEYAAVAALAAGATVAQGASLFTESFATNFSGWQAGVSSGSGAWSWNAGQLRLDFDLQDSFPYPDQGLLTATNTSSGGRFTGSWDDAGADALGFEFVADTVPPNGLEMKLFGPNGSVFSRALAAPPSGRVESYFIPAGGLADGCWLGLPNNTEAAFSAMRTNVQRMRLTVFRGATMTPHSFRVDNIHLTRTHRWDGGADGSGASWLSSSNWMPDGIAGANARVVFTNAGAATVIGVDSSQATGGVLQVGQLFCTVSNRTFENSAMTNDSTIQFNGCGGVFVNAGANTVTFRNGAYRPLRLVGGRYRGEFNVAAGGAVRLEDCSLSETNTPLRVDKLGQGLLFLGASNAYSGGTLLKAGVLAVGHPGALGSGALVADGGTLDLNGQPLSVAGLSGTDGLITDLSAGAGESALTVAGPGEFRGSFRDGAEKAVSLVKEGPGTLCLLGTNTNSGATFVNAGKLLLHWKAGGDTNRIAFATLGSGDVNVAPGATFGGFGRTGGAIHNDGAVTPGGVTGLLLCAGGYRQSSAATITFTLGGTTAAQTYAQTWLEAAVSTNAATNLVTNLVTVSKTYSRMVVDGDAELDGTLRATLTNGLVPAAGMTFKLLSAASVSGVFSPASFSGGNLPPLPAGLAWEILYSATDVVLACVTSGPPPSIYVASATGGEGGAYGSYLEFQFTLSRPAVSNVTLLYATSDGSAREGEDYIFASETLEIPAGRMSATAYVWLTGDDTFEETESFRLDILSAENASIGLARAYGVIHNDDTAPAVFVGDVVQQEGSGAATVFSFPVSLSEPAGAPVSITYATVGGSAQAGTDFTAAGGTIVIPPGATETSLTVAVTADESCEPGETFSVQLLCVSNAVIVNSTASATVLNDDAPPAVSIGGVTQNECNGPFVRFVFPVSLSAPSALPVAIAYATADGSAVAGSDYVAASGLLLIPPGVVQTSITVLVSGDSVREPNENFTVNLLAADTNATVESALAAGFILDDDAPLYPPYFLYAQQIASLAQRGYGDDPDGDGAANLLEFATGGDPASPDETGDLAFVRTDGGLALSFTRNTDSAQEVTFIVEAADSAGDDASWTGIATNSLGVWSGPAAVTETNEGGGAVVRVTVEDPTPSPTRMLRLRVTAP